MPIQLATVDEVGRVAPPVILGYAADPFVRWFLADADSYLTYFPQIIRTHAQTDVKHGGVFRRADFRGTAIWYPPGVEPDGEALGTIFREAADEARVDSIVAAFADAAAFEPSEPHWYLRMIAVDPPLRGAGHGSALMRPGLERADEARQVAYLEATSAPNRAFYERHGFEALDEIQVGAAPPIWPMVREPSAG